MEAEAKGGVSLNTGLSVLTIGHSNHAGGKLIELLRQHRVEVLVDVRSRPYSRFAPQFSRESLEAAVRVASIRYLFMGDALGGRPSGREFYDEDGRVLYDKIEEQDFYRRGIERLLDLIGRSRVCLLCSEEDPARCHRHHLVSRTLVRRGVQVRHVRGDGRMESEDDVQGRYERDHPEEKQLRLL